jgi:hypothetical protein
MDAARRCSLTTAPLIDNFRERFFKTERDALPA